MKRLGCIVLFVILNIFQQKSYAQDPLVDSLNLLLKNVMHDTARCDILAQLSEICEVEDIPKYASPCLKLSETNAAKTSDSHLKNFYLIHVANSLNNLGFLLEQEGKASKAKDYYLRSLNVSKNNKDISGQSAALNNLGTLCFGQGEIENALMYFNKSLELKKEANDQVGVALCLNNIASMYIHRGDVENAINYYHKTLAVREEIKDNNGIASVLSDIGNLYSDIGDIQKSLEYSFKALRLHEKNNNQRGIGLAFNNIGGIYNSQGDTKKCLEYYFKSLKILEQLSSKKEIAVSLNNIGFIYFRIGQNEKALEYYEKAIKIREEINDQAGLSSSINNIGTLYFSEKKYDKALEYYKRAFEFKETIENSLYSLILNNMASALIEINQVNKALPLAIQSMKIAKEIGYTETIKNSANTLKTIYKRQGDFKNAFAMYELEIQMRDSINNNTTKKASIKKQFQYEYEKQAAADSVKHGEEQKVKNAQLAAQTASLKQEKTQRYALYSGLLLVIAFSGFVFNRFRITQKQKKIIEEQKILVDTAYEHLHEKNKEVMDSITYARRIQRALITPESYIEKSLNKLNKS